MNVIALRVQDDEWRSNIISGISDDSSVMKHFSHTILGANYIS